MALRLFILMLVTAIAIVGSPSFELNHNRIIFRQKGYDPLAPTMSNTETGTPNIPIIRKAIYGLDTVKIVKREGHYLYGKKVPPVSVPKTRCMPPTFKLSTIYSTPKWYPEKIINHMPFYKDLTTTGHILEIYPVQYYPLNDTIYVITYLELEITTTKSTLRLTPAEHTIHKNIFVNYDDMDYDDMHVRTLFVSTDRTYNLVQKLATYRNRTQFVIHKKMSDIGRPADLHDYIKQLYISDDGLKNVILVGNFTDIPPLHSNRYYGMSDSLYGQLYGENYMMMNVYVSRLYGNSVENIENQISKIMRQQPLTNNVKFFGIASDESQSGVPTDCEFTRRMHEMIAQISPIPFQYKHICDPDADKKVIISEINNGASFVTYMGHGNGTHWHTSKFGTPDTHLLTNKQNVVVVDVSCLNGNPRYNPFLAESMVTKKYGAVAMYSSVPNADWVPPMYMQYFSFHTLVSARAQITLGNMIYSGSLMACVQYPYSCGKLLDGYVLYGDASMVVRLPK